MSKVSDQEFRQHIEDYRAAIDLSDKEEKRKTVLSDLQAGHTLPKEMESLRPFIENDKEKIKSMRADTSDTTAYSQQVQSGAIQTPTNVDPGTPLTLMNSLTVATFYPSSDNRYQTGVKDTKAFLTSACGSEEKTKTAVDYIEQNHSSLIGLLASQTDKVVKADTAAIKEKGSGYMTRDPQFFDKWQQGLELIDEAKDKISTALKKSEGVVDENVKGVLKEYDKKALSYLQDQIEMTPDKRKQVEVRGKTSEIVEKDVTFGHSTNLRSKEEALRFVQDSKENPQLRAEVREEHEEKARRSREEKQQQESGKKEPSQEQKSPRPGSAMEVVVDESPAPEKKTPWYSKLASAVKNAISSVVEAVKEMVSGKKEEVLDDKAKQEKATRNFGQGMFIVDALEKEGMLSSKDAKESRKDLERQLVNDSPELRTASPKALERLGVTETKASPKALEVLGIREKETAKELGRDLASSSVKEGSSHASRISQRSESKGNGMGI